MNTYKNESTRKAVEAVYNFFAKVDEYKKELAKISDIYGISRAAEYEKQKIADKYKNLHLETYAAIEQAANDARTRAATARENSLSIGNAEKDFALLALPVKLTKDELRVMVKRNEGNTLLARAVGQYAEKNGIEDVELLALRHASTPYEQAVASADLFESTLKRYCKGESVNAVQFMYANGMNMLEEKNVFDNL